MLRNQDHRQAVRANHELQGLSASESTKQPFLLLLIPLPQLSFLSSTLPISTIPSYTAVPLFSFHPHLQLRHSLASFCCQPSSPPTMRYFDQPFSSSSP